MRPRPSPGPRPSMRDDRYWMEMAIEEAQEALRCGEVPIGAVVVHRGEIVGRGRNRIEERGLPFEHAELVAMRHAVDAHGRWVLSESSVYVTVEPCVMCVGAMLLARVPKVVFGAREPRTGACESVLSIPSEPSLDHRLTVIGGVEADRCAALLRSFFQTRREADGETGPSK
jgi:tRNA(adenine34) deaminase